MKKTILLCIAIILTSNIIFSQNLLYTYKSPALSEGKRLIISGNPLFKYNAANSKNSSFSFNIDGYFNYWKFTPNQLVGGYADVFINTSENKIKDTSVSNSSYGSTIYGGISHYFIPGKIYGSGSVGADYYKEKFGEINLDDEFPVYAWLAAGYGSILNLQRFIIAEDFQKYLLKSKVTEKALNYDGMQRLSNLLDLRINGEFEAKYKDNAEIEFFSRLEALLLNEGVLKNSLTAAATMKLYQMLTNTSYIYYPKYTGYQMQAELQYQLSSGKKDIKSSEHYMTFSGVYGKTLSFKTQLIGSAFLSFSLNDSASGFGPGFFHYLNFIPGRTRLDFFTQRFGTGLYGGHYTPAKNISFGFRGDVFHTINSLAGIRAYAEYISLKPSEGDGSNKFEIGARADYNIISKLVLYGQTRFTKVNKLDAGYNIEFGFTYFVF
ncbi:MAG: hypothetical protein HOP31_00625 [Ignavibacteria bacterium]|nr:hypothetical protein [Ignavibacteria bacterium]